MLAIAYPAVRGLILVTLVALVGTVAVSRLVARTEVRDPHAAAVIQGWLTRLPGLLAWFLLTLSLLRGALQVLSFSDPGMPVDTELAVAVLTAGPWGTGWLVQTAAAFILLALSWLLRRDARRLQLTVALMTLILVVAQSGMGHGVEDFWQPLALGRVVHGAHLLGAGLWVGTLLVLAVAVIPSLLDDGARQALGDIIRRFSGLARLGAVLVVLSGLVATIAYVGALEELWTTVWGRLLLLKLGAFLGIATLGWVNWRVITPRLVAGTPPAAGQLRLAVTIETALALLLLAVTAVLVATELPISAA